MNERRNGPHAPENATPLLTDAETIAKLRDLVCDSEADLGEFAALSEALMVLIGPRDTARNRAIDTLIQISDERRHEFQKRFYEIYRLLFTPERGMRE